MALIMQLRASSTMAAGAKRAKSYSSRRVSHSKGGIRIFLLHPPPRPLINKLYTRFEGSRMDVEEDAVYLSQIPTLQGMIWHENAFV